MDSPKTYVSTNLKFPSDKPFLKNTHNCLSGRKLWKLYCRCSLEDTKPFQPHPYGLRRSAAAGTQTRQRARQAQPKKGRHEALVGSFSLSMMIISLNWLWVKTKKAKRGPQVLVYSFLLPIGFLGTSSFSSTHNRMMFASCV